MSANPNTDTQSQATIGVARFQLGRVLATPGALDALADSGESGGHFINRHVRGDWGDCCPSDAAENELSVEKGFRVFSVYHTSKGVKLWVITEADRSATTLLLPEEY